MPKKDGEIVQFQGRLALPLRVPVDISRIEKEFVLVPVDDHHSPQSEFQEPTSDLANVEAEIVGKTQYSHLLQRLMPFSATSFFSATLGTCIIPETLELCDMQLSYNFSAGRSSPADRERVADKYQTEYARVAGPGVIVGVSYVEEEKDKDRSGLSTFLQKLLPEPLYFVAAIHRF